MCLAWNTKDVLKPSRKRDDFRFFLNIPVQDFSAAGFCYT